jgi:hypothetical protein
VLSNGGRGTNTREGEKKRGIHREEIRESHQERKYRNREKYWDRGYGFPPKVFTSPNKSLVKLL